MERRELSQQLSVHHKLYFIIAIPTAGHFTINARLIIVKPNYHSHSIQTQLINITLHELVMD